MLSDGRPAIPVRKGGSPDAGVTMVAVLVALTVLMAVVLGSLAYLRASTKYSRYEQDNDLALAAAQSGLNDLLGRLRADSNYLGNVGGTKDQEWSYCQSPGTSDPKDHFAADCGWSGAEPRWASFGEATGGSFQEFHLVITDYWEVAQSLDVVATGRSRGVLRSVRARLAMQSPPMFLYLSDFEVVDPTDYTAYPNGPTSAVCGSGWPEAATIKELGHAWEIDDGSGDPTRTKPTRFYRSVDGFVHRCAEPSFESWDELNGRVHSNDTIKARGARFSGDFTTSDPACLRAVAGDPNTYKNCVNGSALWPTQAPRYQSPLRVVRTPDRQAIGTMGCQYQGPTRILLDGGEMTVWSKMTTDQPKPECGSPAALASSSGATVPVPPDGLVYVKDIDVSAANTGLTDQEKKNLNRPIPAGQIDGVLPLGSYQAEDQDGPVAPGQTYQAEIAMEQVSKYWPHGNLWLEGQVSGVLTVYSDSSIVITGDLLTEDDSNDLLGLMAAGSIEIYNPILRTYRAVVNPGEGYLWSTPSAPERAAGWPKDYETGPEVLRIEAALLAGNGSFRLQNWKTGGDLGTVQVYGSITQNFRGVLAWETDGAQPELISGYRKNYTYNESLTQRQPLLFSPLSNGTWFIPWMEKSDPAEELKP
ncbi:MAG: hypothetical protein LBJ02_05245 [Bifidobacteriaceae bacterium]|jgi:hypothetical protein|nr:hypothetical protein [Bifidobacteriaceae bacterium]